jgi:hemerythrin-like domain-containing protein
MSEAIQILMDEHRLIEQVLGSLETFAFNLQNGADADRQTVQDFGGFFSGFADKRHHGKEEDRLFTKMNQYGFPKDYGPVAVMLAEHVEGRSHVGILLQIGAGNGPLSPSERDAIIEHALAYIPLLRAHIIKEDNILYPMAVQAIPQAEMDAMLAEFKASEQTTEGEREHDRFRAMAERLVRSHPPDSSRMAAGAGCGGCTGHM